MSRSFLFLALFAVAAQANSEDIWSDVEDVAFDSLEDFARSLDGGSAGSNGGSTPPTPPPAAPTPAPTPEGYAIKPIAIPNTMTGFTKATFTRAYKDAFREATKKRLSIVDLKLSQITIGPVTEVTSRRLNGRALTVTSIKFDTIITLTKAVTDANPSFRDEIKNKAKLAAEEDASNSQLVGIFKADMTAANLIVPDGVGITQGAPTDYTPPGQPPAKEEDKKKFPVAAVVVPVVLVVGLVVMKQKNMACFSKGDPLNNPQAMVQDASEGSAVAHQNAL